MPTQVLVVPFVSLYDGNFRISESSKHFIAGKFADYGILQKPERLFATFVWLKKVRGVHITGWCGPREALFSTPRSFVSDDWLDTIRSLSDAYPIFSYTARGGGKDFPGYESDVFSAARLGPMLICSIAGTSNGKH